MIKLSARLDAILNAIPTDSGLLVDIGCDHGKLIASAYLHGKCDYGVGVDISELSLLKGVTFIEELGLSDKIKFILSDGFEKIQQNVSCTVIAGMGGNEIVKILSMPHNSDFYVLSPHQDAHVLREFMNGFGLKPIRDFVVLDKKKYYPVIVAKKGECNYTEQELFLGKNLPPTREYEDRNALRLSYVDKITKNVSMQNVTKEIYREKKALELWQKSRT